MSKYNHIQPIAKGKGVPVKVGLKEAQGKGVSQRTDISYKARSLGKSAQDDKAQWIRR